MRYYVSDYKLEPDEEEPVLECDICGDGIYSDQEYYYIDVFNICKHCIEDHREIA